MAQTAVLSSMIQRFFSEHQIREYVLWYYTPMALVYGSLKSRSLRLRLHG